MGSIGILEPFTQENNPKLYEPDPATKKGRGHRQHLSRMLWMSQRQARQKKRCNLCGADGHSYKRCPTNYVHDAAEAGPLGNPTDGAPRTPL
jgi:hypothetical protein